jgi:hypothetical protein
VRLGGDLTSPSQDWVLTSFPQAPPVQRAIRPGSYIHVERALVSTGALPHLTLECWVRWFGPIPPEPPGRPTWQGLITQHTYPTECGFGLFIGVDPAFKDEARAALYFGVGQDGRMKVKWWDGAAWGSSVLDWSDMGGAFRGEPSAASFRGHHVSLMAVGVDGRVHHALWDGSDWTAWQDMGGALGSGLTVVRWIGT